jgi:uncharacterized membrane protein YhaH (DUF805 family)
MNLLAVIGFNLRNLFRFGGRQGRASFWPYAAVVLILAAAALSLSFVPEFKASFARFQRFAEAHPDLATIRSGGGSTEISIRGFHPELMPDLRGIVGPIVFVAVVVIALLAAAVTRRLHDRGKTGVWGLLPIPLLAGGLFLLTRLFTLSAFDPALFAAVMVCNLLYLASDFFLVYLLAGEPDEGENRYGPASLDVPPFASPPELPSLNRK